MELKSSYEYGLDKGIKKGIEKGIQQGREEGIEKGIEKGVQQGKLIGLKESRHKIALQMLEKGIDINTICECTKLTEEQVQALQNG